MALDIGRVAYQAYVKHIRETLISEFSFEAPWEAMGKISQDAWRQAGVAVMLYLEQEKNNMEDGAVG
jgi:hypothetical protein